MSAYRGLVIAGQEARIARMALLCDAGGPRTSLDLGVRLNGWWSGTRYAFTPEQVDVLLAALESRMDDTVTEEPRIWREYADLHETLIARMERTN